MSLEQKAQILEAIMRAPCGVRNLVQILRLRATRSILLLKEMEEEGLVESRDAASSKRGRPKRLVTCTPLGSEFLEAYKRMRMKPLRARRADLDRAVKDALYAQRLVARGHSAFTLFMELNTIVSNIKIHSETRENTGSA